ncbi:hypothetical protein WN55_01823, partial [Dufourea novaeangliae]
SIFERLSASLRRSGSFNVTKHNVTNTATSEENAIEVLATVTRNSYLSTRQIPRGSGISETGVLRIHGILPNLLEHVPLNIRTDIWYLHDGCPAQYAHVA